MEKPSLEIGNGNWAIKENSLLGHTTVDGMILPDPITVTRASLATRVNPSGLIEDIAFLGSEEIDNGSFTGVANGTDVTTLTNWNAYGSPTSRNVVDNKLVIVATGANQGAYYGLGTLAAGTYKLSVDITGDVGAGGLFISSASSYNITTSVGTLEHYFEASGSTIIFFRAAANNAGTTSYTNISLKKATINGLAKIDYTDGTASLLVEPARTNTAVNSEKAVLYGYNDSVNVSDVSIITPYGYTSNAVKIEAVAEDNSPIRAASFNLGTYSQNDIVTTSAYVKYNGYRYVQFGGYFGNESARFDLIDGVVIQNLSNVISSSIKKAENGWYKLVTTYTFQNNIGNGKLYAGFVLSPETDFSFTNAPAGGLYAWGFQAELGNYATSYIKTSGTAVTRAQDVIAKTGISDKINSTEGVLFADIATLSENSTTATSALALCFDIVNKVMIFSSSGITKVNLRRNDNASNQILQVLNASESKSFNKIAISYKSGQNKVFVNGSRVFDSNFDSFTFDYVGNSKSFTKLEFANGSSTGGIFEGKARQVQVYKTALTDLELESLTSFASFTEMANTLNYTIY